MEGKTRKERLWSIVEVLSENPQGLWMSEIARQTDLHTEQVSRIIKRNPQLFEIYLDLTPYGVRLKMVRLRLPE